MIGLLIHDNKTQLTTSPSFFGSQSFTCIEVLKLKGYINGYISYIIDYGEMNAVLCAVRDRKMAQK